MAKLVSKVYGDALFEAALEDNRLSSPVSYTHLRAHET